MSFRIDQLAVLNLVTVGNSVTAGSFVRSGGTAAQFLKADGSVDSSTYATQSWVQSQSYLTSVPAHNQAWSTISSTPTTLAGYGIGDAVFTSTSSFTTAGTGWYRVATTAGDGRGYYYIEVYTTGGNHNPSYLRIEAMGDWGNDKLIAAYTDQGFPASAVRITRTASTTFLEVNFTTTILGASLRVVRLGFDSGVSVLSGALSAGGGTIQETLTIAGKISAASMSIAGNTVLHAGNYNSYTPTLTGGGASGTWGINITGTAALETLATVTGRGASTGTAIVMSGGSGTTPTLSLDRNIASPSNYYNGVQLEIKATSGTAGIGLHRNGFSHVGIYHDTSNVLKFDMNAGTVTLNHNTGTIWGTGNLTNLNQLSNGPGYITSSALNSYLPLSGGTMSGNVQFNSNLLQFNNSGVRSWNIGISGGNLNIYSGDGSGSLHYNGRPIRDSYYRTFSGFSDYYSGGTGGWYRVAEITLTSNCSGAVIYGTVYDNRYDGADTYQIALVARSECDFSSNNESHYINVGCTILGSTNFANYRDKIRVVLSASSSGSRTYELQFYETPWNHDTWQIESTGWTVYASPQAPRTAVGTPRVNYISKQNADNYFANTAVYSPIFYDSANSSYYLDLNSTTSIRTVGSWRSDSGAWDGEFSGKIQYHSNHWYFQAADLWIFRNAGGGNVFTVNQSGNGTFSGTVSASNITTGVTASHIVQRDANGYIYANHVNFSTGESENPTISSFITSNGDGWSRKSSLAHVRNQLGNYGGWITQTNALQPVYGNSGSFNIDTNAGQHATVRFSQGTWGGTNPNPGNWSHIFSVNGSTDNRTVQLYMGDIPGAIWWRMNQGGTQHPWERILTSNNFTSFAVPIRGQSNWNDSTILDDVIGLLAWKNYGNGHVIFDASQGTSPSGGGVSQTNATVAWAASYPTLMGWNGSTTYGVRVDSARVADSAGSITGFNNPTTSATANTIAYRDSVGDITVRELVLNVSVQDFTPSSMVAIYPTTNQAVKVTASGARAFLNVPTRTGGDASGTWGINITGSAGSASSASNATNAVYLGSHDLRSIAPNSHDAYKLRFGFTSWANNNTSPWADYLHFRSYSDGSGGSDNLVMFLKSGIGMRIWQQSWNSGTAYSSFVDVIHSGNIGSQSVNYANTAGSVSGGLTTSNYTSTLDGRYFFDYGFTEGYPGPNANTFPSNRSAFTYSNNAPLTGCIAHFGASGYGIQLNGDYQGDSFSMRSRNGDNATWRPWKRLLTDYNYSSYAIARGGDIVDGIIQFRTNLGGYCGSLSSGRMQPYSDSNNSAFMSFHKSGHYAVNLGLDADNVLRIGGWSAAANRWQLDMSGNMTVAGDVTAYSDARVKENVQTVENALDKTLRMRGVTYNRTDSDDKKTKVGVIAQEMLEVLPEVVNQDNAGMYNVSYGNIVGVLIEAIKEQQQQIEELKAKLDAFTK